MKIKIMFDDEVVKEIDVKDAEISESRDVIGIYKSSDFKATGKHKCYEIVPGIKYRISIDYLDDSSMPNSEFYIMEHHEALRAVFSRGMKVSP